MMNAQQKLVSVFLYDIADKNKGAYGDPASNPLFGVTEHLGHYLQDGWQVKNFTVLGGAGGCLSGWIIALLEKPT